MFDLRTGAAIDPISLITDEQIEMTDWELQDFAVQVVRHELEKIGNKLMSSHGNLAVNPSIWFTGASGPEWVVVRAARSPLTQAEPPPNWQEIADGCARISKVGHFASVAVANAEDRSAATFASPLWRGHGLAVRFQGLITGSAISQQSERQPKQEQQPPDPPQWDPQEEGRLEQEAWSKRRQRQRGGPGPETSLDLSQSSESSQPPLKPTQFKPPPPRKPED
jgi:hypothetical protein